MTRGIWGISPGAAADVTHIVKKWGADETSAEKLSPGAAYPGPASFS